MTLKSGLEVTQGH